MVLSALILCVQQLLFISLISLAIVRAYISKILSSLRDVGLSPLIIFLLLATLSIYGYYYYISTTRCCACQQTSDDEAKDLEPEVGQTSLTTDKQVNLAFLASFHNSNIC